jgi:hypothetical protein
VLNPVLKEVWVYQVLGYALLDTSNQLDIRGVGFYLARQGLFIRWGLDDFLPRVTGRTDASLDRLRGEGAIIRGVMRFGRKAMVQFRRKSVVHFQP